MTKRTTTGVYGTPEDGATPSDTVTRLLELAQMFAQSKFRGPIDNRIGPNFGRPIGDRYQYGG